MERFHRHLKVCLRACPQPSAWVSALPIALLGIRAAFREDLGCSSAELVYGTTLRLPAEFFSPSQAATACTHTQYVDSLRSSLSAFRLQDAAPRLANRPAYIPQDLTTTELVYLRTDAVRKPLQPPYSGPYRVLQRSPKYFKIEVNGKSALVSIDRLKRGIGSAIVKREFVQFVPYATNSLGTTLFEFVNLFPLCYGAPVLHARYGANKTATLKTG